MLEHSTFKRPVHFILLWVAIAGLALLVAYILRRQIPIVAVAFFYLSALCLAATFRIQRCQALIFNFAFVLAVAAVLETYFWLAPTSRGVVDDTSVSDFITPDTDLGRTVPPKERTVRTIRRTLDGTLIYDVQYPIDRHGLRKSARPVNTLITGDTGNPQKSIFFFGCSFTFGEGISEDPFPNEYSTITGIRAFNFGLSGYGPHQMLRALEIDRPKRVVSESPAAIVYTLLPASHLWRAAGRAPWDPDGPRYEVIDGKATYMGPFSAHQGNSSTRSANDLSDLPQRALYSSRIYAEFLHERIMMHGSTADRKRVLAILLAARKQAAEKYQAPLLVVLWDIRENNGSHAEWFAQRLEENRIPTFRVSKVLPQLASNEYVVNFPFDTHPNGKANTLVAKAIVPFIASNIRTVSKD